GDLAAQRGLVAAGAATGQGEQGAGDDGDAEQTDGNRHYADIGVVAAGQRVHAEGRRLSGGGEKSRPRGCYPQRQSPPDATGLFPHTGVPSFASGSRIAGAAPPPESPHNNPN